jgi:hypothetical protein
VLARQTQAAFLDLVYPQQCVCNCMWSCTTACFLPYDACDAASCCFIQLEHTWCPSVVVYADCESWTADRPANRPNQRCPDCSVHTALCLTTWHVVGLSMLPSANLYTAAVRSTSALSLSACELRRMCMFSKEKFPATSCAQCATGVLLNLCC